MRIELSYTDLDYIVEALEDYIHGCVFIETRNEIKDLTKRLKDASTNSDRG